MPNKPWTKEEVDFLKFCFENKKRSQLKLIKRGKKSIRRKMISLGLIFPRFKVKKSYSKKRWSEDEITKLKAEFLSKKDIKKIKIENRSYSSIREMLLRLKLISQGASKKAWLKKEEELLARLVKKEGKTARQIFDLKVLPYSKNSIQKKMCYMGLAHKREKKHSKLSADELSILKKFLKENWKGKTPEDLVLIWNNKPYFKVNKSKVLYHLNNLGCKISYSEVARIKNLRKKEEEVKHCPHKNQKELDESLRSLRIEMMRNRLSKGRDIWTGLHSDEAALVESLEF